MPTTTPTTLEQIKTKLLTVMTNVYYGLAQEIEAIEVWDYIVFSRETISRNANHTGLTDFYAVNIVCENWIPEAKITDTISAMEQIAGMRLANNDITFAYTEKPSTKAVVEIATLKFCKPRKC